MSGEPILIVDDNAANAILLSFILTKKGYEVRTAGDAQEALDILEEFRPRMIMMDVQLPGMDGLELTRRLKANRKTSQIIVIALTAYAMKGDEERVRQAGCDGYVSKPIDTRALPGLVAEHLRRASEAAINHA
jgi:two-component system, cell cycle response regulator DivK